MTAQRVTRQSWIVPSLSRSNAHGVTLGRRVRDLIGVQYYTERFLAFRCCETTGPEFVEYYQTCESSLRILIERSVNCPLGTFSPLRTSIRLKPLLECPERHHYNPERCDRCETSNDRTPLLKPHTGYPWNLADIHVPRVFLASDRTAVRFCAFNGRVRPRPITLPPSPPKSVFGRKIGRVSKQ